MHDAAYQSSFQDKACATDRRETRDRILRLWFDVPHDVETHHQTGGESWGVRRGGRHGKGDCQLRRYHRNKRQLHQQFVFSDRIQIQLSSGSSADRAVAVVEQQKRRDGSTYRGGEKRC